MKKVLATILGSTLAITAFAGHAHATMSPVEAKAVSAYRDEKAQFNSINGSVQQENKTFMSNLAKAKSYSWEQKRSFVVDTYKNAFAFFSKQHDLFTTALTQAKAKGVDITEAKVHFDKAWSILTTANATIEKVQGMDLRDTASRAQAKTAAVSVENAYKSAREEMRAGAKALRSAYLVRVNESGSTKTPVGAPTQTPPVAPSTTTTQTQ